MAVKQKFVYKLGDAVTLTSGEGGTVIGRAHYLDSNPQYLVRYADGTGRLVENWWFESAINNGEAAPVLE